MVTGRKIEFRREYCPDCGAEVNEETISEEALEAGDDPVCDDCWDRRQEAREDWLIRREEDRREEEREYQERYGAYRPVRFG